MDAGPQAQKWSTVTKDAVLQLAGGLALQEEVVAYRDPLSTGNTRYATPPLRRRTPDE